jgi:hypothetical protein
MGCENTTIPLSESLARQNPRARGWVYQQLNGIPFYLKYQIKRGLELMRIVEEYLINERTVLLMNMYDPFLNLCTIAFDGEEKLLVKVPPVTLIHHNISLDSCFDFRGALITPKFLVEGSKMPPIYINSERDICLFPARLFNLQNCPWFSHSHIKEAIEIDSKKTMVHTSFGHMFEINMEERVFNNKRQKVKLLKDYIANNKPNSDYFYFEPKKDFYIKEDQLTNKYITYIHNKQEYFMSVLGEKKGEAGKIETE